MTVTLPSNRTGLPTIETIPLAGPSPGNSTDTPLVGGATFTGPWEDWSAYGTVRIKAKADVASAVNGLQVQWSILGTAGADETETAASVLAGVVYDSGIIVRRAQFGRVVFTNGAGAQAAFALRTLLFPVGGSGGGGGGGGGSPLTTKGDIYTRDAAVDARRSVGTDGYVLRAASGDPVGIAWGQLTYDDILAAYSISAAISVTAAEIGNSVVNPTVTVTVNRTPAAASVNDGVHGAEARVPLGLVMTLPVMGHTYTHNVIGAVDTFTATANESGGPTKTGYCYITWTARAFYGVAVVPGAYNEAFIEGLATSVQSTARQRTLGFASAGLEHEYYCIPSAYGGAPANFVDVATGFAAGYAKIAAAVAVTNAFGVTVNYDVWESTNFGLGARNVAVS